MSYQTPGMSDLKPLAWISMALLATLAAAQELPSDEPLDLSAHPAEAQPIDQATLLSRGRAALEGGDPEGALVHFRQAIELDPSEESARLSEVHVLHSLGRFAEVVERLEEAREALPSSGRVAYGLAWILAASPDPSVRDGERALVLAEQIFEASQLLQNGELVAEALAELDRCQEAAEWMQGVADSAEESNPSPEIRERLRRSIDRFTNDRPCRAAAESSASGDP